MDIVTCAFEPASYILFSPDVPPLIYYSHFVAIAAALLIGLLVFVHNTKLLLSRLFLWFATVFSLWALLDVVLWATNDPGVVMFSWSIQVLAEPLLFAMAFYMFYIFLNGSTPTFRTNLVISILLLPLIFLLPTKLNLEAVYLSYCEAEEGLLAMYYTYFLNITFVGLIVYNGFRHIPTLSRERKWSALYFIIGLLTFLLSFTSGNIISSFTDDWTISQYGLFGMPIFASLIAYSIVRFRTFNIQIAGAQVLVLALWGLVASLLFVQSELQKIITTVTLVFTFIAGLFLIRSVKKEFAQRLELESLTQKLSRANKRLKQLDKLKSEFVSIASHQLRSPLTSIRGYSSMLLDGSYGKIPEKAKDAISRIDDSSRYMALSVEDYLNVSRIEAGNMKYETADFNLIDMASKLVDDLRREAIKRGHVLKITTNTQSRGIVSADPGKTRQIIHNLIDNAMKYTEHGSITVHVREKKRPKQIMVDVTDTGIGMSQETIDDLFNKFHRAKNANDINVTGTGLGLFVAHQMAEGMGGTLTASSPGEGEGSTFTLTLPLKM